MALKVTISLSGSSVITLESTDSQLYSEVVNLALRELPKDLVHLQVGGAAHSGMVDKGTNVTLPAPEAGTTRRDESEPGVGGAPGWFDLGKEVQESFTSFCGELAPMGDMRRVVVAAEGARRFLSTDSVSAKELGNLFDLAGWLRPADFLQTLRNAARKKFRWLERVPGTTGYYTVTAMGRDAVVGNGE